jgi:CRP/FNR family transcriptional regulator
MPVLLEELPFFYGVSEEDLSSIKKRLREKPFRKGEVLFFEGNACAGIFFVKSGWIKLYRTSDSGTVQSLEVLGPGEACTCNPGARDWICALTGQALTPCTVWFLPKEDYVKLVESSPEVSHLLNRIFAEKLQRAGSSIAELSSEDSRKRLAHLLLELLAKGGRKGSTRGVISVPLTREELAEMIGTSRETVVRQLYELRREKLIDIQSRKIVVLDPLGLKNLL